MQIWPVELTCYLSGLLFHPTFWDHGRSPIDHHYRNPYQCRHTYATMMLSSGEDVFWIASQMGHVDSEIVVKIYAKKFATSTDYQCKNDWEGFFNGNRPHIALDSLAA